MPTSFLSTGILSAVNLCRCCFWCPTPVSSYAYRMIHVTPGRFCPLGVICHLCLSLPLSEVTLGTTALTTVSYCPRTARERCQRAGQERWSHRNRFWGKADKEPKSRSGCAQRDLVQRQSSVRKVLTTSLWSPSPTATELCKKGPDYKFMVFEMLILGFPGQEALREQFNKGLIKLLQNTEPQ